MTLDIDGRRLASELDALAAFSDSEAPAVTRVVFSNVDLAARAYVRQLCEQAGLVVRQDAVGNTFARLTGTSPDLAPVATGSHIDAIPNAGRYDGTVGVLGGLAALRALSEQGVRPKRSLELVLFTSEEPTRFGIGCLGSRLLSGVLDAESAARLVDTQGETLDAVRAIAGFTAPLSSVPLSAGAYHAFVELHIEQGPALEQQGLDIGIVTAIAAPAALTVLVEGEGGHAGAVLMLNRRDAFLAAAEIALAVEAAAKATAAVDTVATTGVCHVFPGAVNSVPSRTQLQIDVRDIDEARRNAVLDRIAEACDATAARRRVRVTRVVVNADAPATCSPMVTAAIARSAGALHCSSQQMISRAYHDALFMSRIAPTGMIFIPCRGGVSHRPDEYASPEAIARGVEVLAATLVELSA